MAHSPSNEELRDRLEALAEWNPDAHAELKVLYPLTIANLYGHTRAHAPSYAKVMLAEELDELETPDEDAA